MKTTTFTEYTPAFTGTPYVITRTEDEQDGESRVEFAVYEPVGKTPDSYATTIRYTNRRTYGRVASFFDESLFEALPYCSNERRDVVHAYYDLQEAFERRVVRQAFPELEQQLVLIEA